MDKEARERQADRAAMEWERRQVRAWKLTPVFDPEPGQVCNSGTTLCIATGAYLMGTDVGDALSPEIVAELRRTDVPRIVCDATENDKLRDLAYAPDGKEWRSMVYEEVAKRLPLEETIKRLQVELDQVQRSRDGWIEVNVESGKALLVMDAEIKRLRANDRGAPK